MTARILILDIETQRAVVETFSLFRPFIGIDRVIRDSRILCFAARWRGEERMIFKASWVDADEESYRAMLETAWNLLNEADFVCGFNSDRFDLQWLEEEFGRLGLGRPAPYKSIDLFKVQKRHFRAGLLSGKLDWSSRTWLKDRKVPHGGSDLWHDIRYGNRKTRREAQRTMKTYNCLTPDHKVLTTDLRWVEIGSLNVGDNILGFDENQSDSLGTGRRYRKATVLGNRRVVDDVYKVTMSNGDQIRCTGDHKWLAGSGSGKKWVQTAPAGASERGGCYGLRPGRSRVFKYLNVVDEIQEKDAGWLSGMFDGEGSLCNRKLGGKQAELQVVIGGFSIGVSQKKGPELDRLSVLLDRYGIAHSEQKFVADYFASKSRGAIKRTLPIGVIHIGKFTNQLEFLQKIRPERLMANINWDSFPRMEGRDAAVIVEKVEYIGKAEIVILETDTRTYIADGYAMHNCHDVALTEKLLEAYLPWTNVNLALYEDNDDDLLHCTKCNSTNLKRDGKKFHATTAFLYQMHRCKDCGATSRGRKAQGTTELRAV